MIITTCPACAAPLAHDAPRCIRCHTRYCNKTCQWAYAIALYQDAGATLDDLREAVTTLEDTARIARRVFGGAHSTTGGLGRDLSKARFYLSVRETPSPGSA